MTYCADLTPHTYATSDSYESLSVGWLDEQFPFPTGDVPQEVLDRLDDWREHNAVHLHRGSHACQFCTKDELYETTHHETYGTGRRMRRERHGNGSIVVIAPTGQYYTAPVLITHYIREHRYLPPAEFIDAVLHGQPWDDGPELAAFHERMEQSRRAWLEKIKAMPPRTGKLRVRWTADSEQDRAAMANHTENTKALLSADHTELGEAIREEINAQIIRELLSQ